MNNVIYSTRFTREVNRITTLIRCVSLYYVKCILCTLYNVHFIYTFLFPSLVDTSKYSKCIEVLTLCITIYSHLTIGRKITSIISRH